MNRQYRPIFAALTLSSLAFAPAVMAQPLANDFADTGQKASVLSQKQFADAAVGNVGMLSFVRDWRDTFKGSGKAPKRDLLSMKFLGQSTKFSLGAVAPPSISGLGGAGMAASFGMVEVGSTARPGALNNLFNRFDEAMTGQKIAPTDQQSVAWLRAKPISNKDAELELDLSRGAKDIQPGEGENWQTGTFEGLSGRLNLPARWKGTANITRAQMAESEAKTDWNAHIEGPLVHPFGEAKVSAQWGSTDAGYQNLATQNINGTRAGSADISQDLKIGFLTGNLNAHGEKSAREDTSTAAIGDEVSVQRARTGGSIKLSLFPFLSLNAQGQLQFGQSEKLGTEVPVANASDSSTDTPQAPLSMEEAQATQTPTTGPLVSRLVNPLDETQTRGGDVGAELKLSPTLSVTTTVGRTQILNSRYVGDDHLLLPGTAENRLGLQVRRQTGGGMMGMSFSTRDRSDDANPDSNWQHYAALRLEAERRLVGTFRLRTCANFAHDRDASWSDEKGLARRFEAGLTFNKASSLNLSYRDGAALPDTWRLDPLGSPFSDSTFVDGGRQIAARFNTGSTAGGKGFGMSFEYAMMEAADQRNGTWKVGLTYK